MKMTRVRGDDRTVFAYEMARLARDVGRYKRGEIPLADEAYALAVPLVRGRQLGGIEEVTW
jgi:hypothetical protein